MTLPRDFLDQLKQLKKVYRRSRIELVVIISAILFALLFVSMIIVEGVGSLFGGSGIATSLAIFLASVPWYIAVTNKNLDSYIRDRVDRNHEMAKMLLKYRYADTSSKDGPIDCE